MKHKAILTIGAATALLSATAFAQTIDGTRDGVYGSALATQTVTTQFGDSTAGDGSSSGGSELDAAYGFISGGNLNLFIAGNLEQNGNNIDLFIADGRAGQSTLSAVSSGGGSEITAMNGSAFSPNFGNGATYALNLWVGPSTTLHVNGYNLVANTASFSTLTLSSGVGSGSLGAIGIGFNDSNGAGIAGGSPAAANQAAADAVTTGLELAIPLSLLGSPSGSIEVLADVNGGNNGYLSNQFLAGLAGTPGNLGTATFNFGSTPDQFFTLSVPEPSGLALLGVSGLAALLAIRRRHNRS